MTPAEIIAMAKEAGFVAEPTEFAVAYFVATDKMLQGFAALVAAKERKACAQACDAIADRAMAAQGGALDASGNVMLRQIAVLGSGSCARAIRARGQS